MRLGDRAVCPLHPSWEPCKRPHAYPASWGPCQAPAGWCRAAGGPTVQPGRPAWSWGGHDGGTGRPLRPRGREWPWTRTLAVCGPSLAQFRKEATPGIEPFISHDTTRCSDSGCSDLAALVAKIGGLRLVGTVTGCLGSIRTALPSSSSPVPAIRVLVSPPAQSQGADARSRHLSILGPRRGTQWSCVTPSTGRKSSHDGSLDPSGQTRTLSPFSFHSGLGIPDSWMCWVHTCPEVLGALSPASPLPHL